ncbi:uracil-DNA glycosylase family protein [Biformimicrobium ophioploci]|uniref:Uracil-DNA glycosylase family protein n=1 Tax=Biformimicrobium ophioploci TaxID=3036711 RepID=A0ABQ6LZ40_9GAMM|nr:uracil-DNA glycosylase family protein [Microbulbifer sp. NKW57]GMG87363.1 uracil-DNA glycosylase family protein [Microbulbifer sp. NKW57]
MELIASDNPAERLLTEVRACSLCRAHLPLGPRPVLQLGDTSKIVVIGQAPGLRVHETGVPWNDPSGERLRGWMGIAREDFYDPTLVSIFPMGFCYPGRGRSGDLPPRPECAPRWHAPLWAQLQCVELVLCVGQYAQNFYLPGKYTSLTARVAAWRQFTPRFLPLVHPSPRNTHWLQKNPWFEAEVVPWLRARVAQLITDGAGAAGRQPGA